MDVSRWTSSHVLQCVDVEVIPASHCPFIVLEIIQKPWDSETIYQRNSDSTAQKPLLENAGCPGASE